MNKNLFSVLWYLMNKNVKKFLFLVVLVDGGISGEKKGVLKLFLGGFVDKMR